MTHEMEPSENIVRSIADEKKATVESPIVSTQHQSSTSSNPHPAVDGIARSGTGPRTHDGKQRSKINAITHGIFSSVVILKGESRSEFEALLDDLRNDFQPAGRLEETLVEKLAVLLWKQ